MFRLTDTYPLPLAETVAIALGATMLRQGDAIAKARSEDESVDHAMKTTADLMRKMELSQAQKILLRFNVDMKHSCYCHKMTYRTNGHGKVALAADLPMARVWESISLGSRGSGTACGRTRTGTTTVTITQSMTSTWGSVCRTSGTMMTKFVRKSMRIL